MKYKKLGIFLLAAAVICSMTGCELPFFQNAKNTSVLPVKAEKETMKVEKPINQNLGFIPNRSEPLQVNIRNYLRLFNNISGSISVVQNRQILFREGFGLANIESHIENNPNTSFPVGSISKIFTATSIMILQEQHKLSIQDPVSKYIPNFPNAKRIKLYNLMSHTSGIQGLNWHTGDTTPLKLVKEIAKYPVKFQPGTKWDYRDTNYILLGYIVEKVSGEPLHSFIQKNIFDKVQMTKTGFMTHQHPAPYSVTGYVIKNNQFKKSQIFNAYALYACGDIYSTPYDLSLFDQALMNGELVSLSSLKQMLTPGSKSKYGLGLYYNGIRAWSNGVLPGYYTTHSYFNDKTSIVLFLNKKDPMTQLDQMVLRIHEIVNLYQEQPTQTLEKTTHQPMSGFSYFLSRLKYQSG
ncbi:beta-lactamase family protein [Bacillus sp. BRMEA1]|uniref:serine hydrolase domain-containing protein n=1 Tax=Neobacillus endophyticus TaxID=2738405 RepID=UPI001567BAAA|nr:serine hydrolase domain-containing protein [Neobacillus endophyticus]NRD76022.1 beta-lactamase family protein [Neobacillus endophyticus]